MEIAAQRRAKRGQAQEIFEIDDFQRDVAELYQAQAQAWQASGQPIHFVDAARSFEEVSTQLEALILPALASR